MNSISFHYVTCKLQHGHFQIQYQHICYKPSSDVIHSIYQFQSFNCQSTAVILMLEWLLGWNGDSFIKKKNTRDAKYTLVQNSLDSCVKERWKRLHKKKEKKAEHIKVINRNNWKTILWKYYIFKMVLNSFPIILKKLTFNSS